MTITQEILHLEFEYDPQTGAFDRRDKSKKRRAHTGTINHRAHSDYAALCVNAKKIYAHRAAWMYVYGEIQDGLVVDHIDGNGLNNSIANLRLVTKSINQRNRNNRIKKTSAIYMGVYAHRSGFTIQCAGKYIGWTKDLFEAICIKKNIEVQNGYLIKG